MRVALTWLTAIAFAMVSLSASAQGYPSKPIRLIVPFSAGGTADTIARIIAKHLSSDLGQSVVVDNRTGANGIVGTEIVAKSPPDGYTLLLAPSGHAINNSLNSNVPYDPVKDFETITLIGTVPMVVTVNPNVPVKSIADLIALAKSKPGGLSFGSRGPGSSNQLAVELFDTMAGIKMVHVPYRGDAPGIIDLLGGQIQLIFLNIPAALPLVNTGKARAIGITSRTRSPLLPDVPTVAETVPGYEAGSWHGIFAPAGTPKPIIQLLSTKLRKILMSPEVHDVLARDGVNVVASTPEEFAAFLKSEIDKWAGIIKAANVKL
ncbi:MAG TPA: tripartite tricarboxylate transporter substrate binding protein [Burkholderiales bacterium]|nr:tripartite tricarboxylate transporter substrate binding protein [Burkholderiales bacterium]